MKNNKKVILLYVFCLVILVSGWSFVTNDKMFYYDSGYYWNLAKSYFDQNNCFTFSMFSKSIRGYFFPMILAFCMKCGNFVHDDYLFFRVLYSFLCVTLLVYIVPKLLNVYLGDKRWIIGSFVNVCIFLFFWKDYVTKPLSDLFAVWLFGVVLLLLKDCVSDRLKNRKYYILIIYGILLGAIMYMTYNTRTVYLIPIGAIFLICVLTQLIRKNYKFILVTGGVAVGILLCGFPQINLNKKYFNNSSPMLVTEYAGKDNLFVYQLYVGMDCPRYETYVGDEKEYHDAGVMFINKTGENIKEDIDDISGYIKWFFKHPLEVIGIYTEHVISGITLLYNEAYINNIRINGFIFLFNVIIYLTAFIGSLQFVKREKIPQSVLWSISLCTPAILAIPGAIEVRFFMPIYLIVYSFLCYKLSYKRMWDFVKQNKMWILIIALGVLMIWCMCVNNLLTEVKLAALDFNGNIYYH